MLQLSTVHPIHTVHEAKISNLLAKHDDDDDEEEEEGRGRKEEKNTHTVRILPFSYYSQRD
jgi:hypothetical protein